MIPIHIDECDPKTRAKVLQQIGEPEGTSAPTQPPVPTGATVALTPQETELVRLHQSTTRDTIAIGTLLIAMRGEQPRGEWTAYLEGIGTRMGISRRSLFRYIAAVEKPEKTKKTPPPDFRTARSPHGHDMGTLQSWLQKAIRRGDVDNALYAAKEFSLTGFDGAIFNICLTAASEEIGLAERGLVPELVGLHAAYKIEVARKSEHHPERLQITHAVLLCCRAAKSRLVDHALIVAFEGSDVRTPPEWVFDIHTHQGKAAGKTVADFFVPENADMNPKSTIEDPYANQAKQIRTQKGVA